MNRLALLLLLVVAGAAALGMAIAQNAGYVLVAYQGFRFEASLWATLGLVAAVWALFYGLRFLLGLLLGSIGLVNPWSGRNRSRRARLSAEQGFMDLQEGRWVRAQRHLLRAAEGSEQPLMYYLGAARAAQQLGKSAEADALLERALNRQPRAELAVALAHAELQVTRGDRAAARETLQAMQQRYPEHHQVLRELAWLYRDSRDFSALLGLLPQLRKSKALSTQELSTLELQTWQGRLDEVAQEGGDTLQALNAAWQQVSASLRQQPELLLGYAGQLHRLGADAEAEQLLRKAIRLNYDARLVRLYGLLRGSDALQQLHTAEGWLPQQPKDPLLLLSLGRLCLSAGLWGKARDYFEASLVLQPAAESCTELARLLGRLGEVERSHQLYQQGLELLGQALPALPLPPLGKLAG
ncbi:heme biosynthesis HemY N-terminal domain-containing protein [Pseudomonas sp. N040]|uniref:heme biosynthesis HemY N-terminal domain-containing protein n=1 Tax=Pseudomonas sp. N040 TaxID=2785325 RepID=UPI0018A2738E|nr:heme biosynthesis HemY N-terminal domain-containing protein [Pseudomonas sp. N040]MBF7730141.1 heme biosynthesis protein HemY [Pseudomonas sp. N040]MBW7013783.1 heme biosynthesis protein HemY [Pseudomonas sp. N040]